MYVFASKFRGKVLYEHANKLISRGKIIDLLPQADGTIIIVTAEGEYAFYNRVNETGEGYRLEGDFQRYGLIKRG